MSVPGVLARVRQSLAVAVVAGLGFAACGSDSSDADSQTDSSDAVVAPPDAADTGEPADEVTAASVVPNGETVEVIALDNSFRPENTEVSAGTAVRWENRGRNDHNIVPADDTETWGAPTEEFLAGDEYTWVFSEPGTYAYYCSIHATKDAGMIGTIVVTPAN